MTLADYQAQALDRLATKHDKLIISNREERRADQLAHLNGSMDASEYEMRECDRLSKIASYEDEGDLIRLAMKRAESAFKKASDRLRWNSLYNKYARYFPLYGELDLTKAERAVLCGMMLSAKGETRFAVAKSFIADKAGTTAKTVQRALHRLASHGLIYIRERRIKGKAMNLYNEYSIRCPKIKRWMKEHFISIKQDTTDPHPQGGLNLVSTEEENKEGQEPDTTNAKTCRQKAERYEEFEATCGIQSEEFVLLATGALRELDVELPDKPNEDELIAEIEAYRAAKNPNYKKWFWDQGVKRHGYRRALLSVLSTHITRKMRLSPIPDKRPWNEREVVKCPDRYLSGLLDAKTPCRPEITLGSALLAKQIYELPAELVRKVRAHNQLRAKLKRNDNSAVAA